MELTIIDTITVESCGSFEEHLKLIREQIEKECLEYYTVQTELCRLLWHSKITIMERA